MALKLVDNNLEEKYNVETLPYRTLSITLKVNSGRVERLVRYQYWVFAQEKPEVHVDNNMLFSV